jgi:hypothetical protein
MIVGYPVETKAVEKLIKDKKCFQQYINYADKNRIILLAVDLLQQYSQQSLPHYVRELVSELERKFHNALSLIRELTHILNSHQIQYSYIKTIRPYRAPTVDVDILLLNGRSDVPRIVKILRGTGYRIFAAGPESVTFSTKYNVRIDVYVEVAASRIVYFPREIISPEDVIYTEYYDISVPVLRPEYEFLIVSGHSVFKEQMFTLADFVMLRVLLSKSSDRLEKVSGEIGAGAHMDYALRYINRVLSDPDSGLPVKVDPGLILYYLLWGMMSGWMRKSISLQLYYMMKPRRLFEVVGYLVEHAVREKY